MTSPLTPEEIERNRERFRIDGIAGMLLTGDDDPLWWLSFADPGLPEGSQFLGVAIVQAPEFPAAVTRTHALGINPGGGIQGAGPIPAEHIARGYWDRLLTKAEAEAIPEPR
jgi:hypothetical protein